MSSDIPDWVRTDCRAWGRQKRRIWEGKDWHGNIDGYAQSLLGRIREEREGAGQGTPAQRWPEVFWGAGLDVQRCLMGMPERQFAVLHFQYVWNPEWGITAERKARLLSIGRTEYIALTGRAENWVFARLAPEGRGLADAQVAEQVTEIIRAALQTDRTQATKAHPGETPLAEAREINYAALNRKTLSMR